MNRAATKTLRTAAVSLVAMLACVSPADAQFNFGKVPFADPQDMFDQMFGEDSPADREALRKIKISAKDERDLGKQILDSGLAAWKKEGINVVSKGEDVEYLQSLID